MTVSKIWVFAEASDGKVSNTTLEMLTKARELADTVECVSAHSRCAACVHVFIVRLRLCSADLSVLTVLASAGPAAAR